MLGTLGKEWDLTTVGVGVDDGCGGWTEEMTCPGKTGRTGVDMLIPGMDGDASVDEWLIALTDGGVGAEVAAGLEP